MQTRDDVRSQLTDAQLVSISKQGDRDAFDELIRRHRRRCVSLAASILRDHTEAEEETQNACLKAFEHLDQFRGEAEFLTWLLRIVENQCLILIRRKRRAQFVHLDERAGERGNESMQLSTHEDNPEGELGNREVFQVLRTEIRRIPPLLRNVIVMFDMEELPMSDERYGCPAWDLGGCGEIQAPASPPRVATPDDETLHADRPVNFNGVLCSPSG